MPGAGQKQFAGSVVAIGASGGAGLADMAKLLALLPADFAGAVLLTLHRPVDRPSYLAQVLRRQSPLPVLVARPREALQPGTCYVGEPDAHLALCSPTTIELVADVRNGYRNGTIDLLFGSVATHAAGRGIGVVLSGCLRDGSRGLSAIVRAGGIGMARVPRQDFQGDMPRNAIAAAGLLQCVGSLPELAQALERSIATANSRSPEHVAPG